MKREKDINTEKKILDVALELFAKKGFEGTSIRDICREAGVNISLISYYFGGKTELYKKIVENIVSDIINYFDSNFTLDEGFKNLPKEQKINIFLSVIEKMIDYFYSERMSDSKILVIMREQLTSNVTLNSEGYKRLKRLLAWTLGKDENDKEIIFRCLSIVGQIHSARVLSQFSLGLMNQSGYGKEDIQMLKQIITSQIKSVLKDIGEN